MLTLLAFDSYVLVLTLCSIYFYLMDPEGEFVEAIGRQHSPENAASIILGHIGDWRGPIDGK